MSVDALRYMRAMARELAVMADKERAALLAHLFRMAELAAVELVEARGQTAA
jgi:hypothetical protein